MVHAGLGIDWNCLFANDISPIKGASYAENWGMDAMTLQDINTVNPKQLEGVADLAWASFPCQDLSLAGNGAGLEGIRSGAFWPFIRLMNELKGEKRQPKLIALENVCGALTSRGGMDFVAMVEALANLKYRMGAMDSFGRERSEGAVAARAAIKKISSSNISNRPESYLDALG